jgi:hypothetical protein
MRIGSSSVLIAVGVILKFAVTWSTTGRDFRESLRSSCTCDRESVRSGSWGW